MGKRAVQEIEEACHAVSAGASGRPSEFEADDQSSRTSEVSPLTINSAEEDVEKELPSPAQQSSSDDSSVEAATAADPLLLELEDPDETRRQNALEWVRASFWPLALTKRGCRIVQKAVDVGTP